MPDPSSAPVDDAPGVAARSPDGSALAGDGETAASGSLAAFAVTIARPRAELFAFFRDFSNLPGFMENVEAIEVLDDRRSAWSVSGPTGTLRWVSQITEEQPDALIAWASEEGGDVANSGRVTFVDAPGGRGTVVSATILYEPPYGAIGKLVAKLTQQEPNIQVRRDLRRLKQLLETGEIPTNAWTNEQTRAELAPKS
jgi:uncharacterized membrane protein